MKFLHLLVCCLAFLVTVNCQNDETFSETLLRAQKELDLGHLYAENVFINHRTMISEVLEKLTKFSIDKYMDSIAVIRRVAQETRETMMQYEASPCTDNARSRWERQVLSHGNRINYCIKEATRILIGEWYDLYYYDMDGGRVSNHTPNQGLNILSQNDVMDSEKDFYKLINNRFRDLILRVGPWMRIMDELLELMDHHTEIAEFGVTMCTMMTTLQFDEIAAKALEDIETCRST